MNLKEIFIAVGELALIGFPILFGLSFLLKSDEFYNDHFLDSKFCAMGLSKSMYKKIMRFLGFILISIGLSLFWWFFLYTPEDELAPVKEFWKDIEDNKDSNNIIFSIIPFAIAIPARMASTRFPGKPLAKLKGKAVIERVYEKCTQSKHAGNNVYILTDSEEIADFANKIGAKYLMTSKDCQNGTERIVEASDKISANFYINVQGDEPFIPTSLIDSLIEKKIETNCDLVTAVSLITDAKDLENPNVVKALRSSVRGNILYFSRSPLPFIRGQSDISQWLKRSAYYKHIGIYGYSKEVLGKYNALPNSVLEKCEMLEQLRFVDAGYEFEAVESKYKSIGIDTPEDLANAEKFLESNI